MSSEETSLQRRAERHAALGDTARLRIVDLLALGDRSVGQIRAELGIPGNLLSHHLAVLSRAGSSVRPVPRAMAAVSTCTFRALK